MLYKECLLVICAFAVVIVNPQGLQTCVCQAPNTCYQPLATDGTGLIDIRIVNSGTGVTSAPPGTTVTPPGIVTCTGGLQNCCTGAGVTGCGLRWNIPPTPITTPGPGQARYGSQPWQAVILGTDNTYLGGGVLLDSLHVLTAAHKIANRTAGTFKVRMGEWDSNRNIEPYPTQEAIVTQIRIHPSYTPSNLLNDVAVLRLATAIQLGAPNFPAINTGCLPVATTVFDNMRCLVSGWGKDAFTGTFQSIIKEVEVPVLTNADCQTRLRRTRLGASYVLNTNSFICAGGEAGRDACVGDGGSALACSIGGKYQVVGLVAWGIGCADATIPGVYVRVQSFIPWIQQNLV
ncbi:uncharacterized protein CBL_11215 [Carabus blaptoides fortunei]